MALTQPYNLLPDFPGWTTSFDLLWRQEQSRTAGGQTIVKDLGSPLWQLKAQSKTLRANELDHWRARLSAMENGFATFYAFPLSRKYPILYPFGGWPTGSVFNGYSANLFAINTNRKSIRVSALPVGFTLSVGDYISFGSLHQVMETAIADGSGVTPSFEVRPHLWPETVTGITVSVKTPSCVMTIMPGSISSESGLTGTGSVSFQALETR